MTVNEPSVKARVLADRYRLGTRRGSGLDIAIFEAFDQRDGQVVAVKVVHPDLCDAPGFVDEFEATMERAETVVHPNISRLIDWGIADWDGRRVVFTVSENLTGGSLRDMLDRGRQLSPSQGLIVGLDVCKALDKAHRAGLVHGDIRPSNLVFGDDGLVRITDLGLAFLVAEPMWAVPSSVPLNRAFFAAPEQAQGRPAEARTDVYALCLTLLEAMTGTLPFVGDSTVATLANRVDRLMPVSADLGPLAAVLERAGRPDPADRWTAAEFGKALVQTAEKLPRPAPLPLLASSLFADSSATASMPVVAAAATAAADVAAAEATIEATDPTDATDLDDLHVVPPPIPVPDPLPPPQAVEPNLLSTVPVAPAAPPVPLPTEPVPQSEVVPAVEHPAAAAAAAATAGPSSASSTGDADEPTEAFATTIASASGDDAMGSARSEIPPPPPPEREPPLLKEKRSRRKLLGVIALLLAAATIGGVLAWFFGRTPVNTVPDLVGLTQGEAENAISEYGWEVTVLEEANDDVEAGVVIRTDPIAGTTLDEGADFLMVVSNGPAPRVLPEITGLTVPEATTVLAELDLTLQLGGEEHSETAPAGTIISWTIPAQPSLVAGDTVVPGTALVATLSSGPAPRIVPDVTGLALADATARLQAEGLVVVQLPDEFSSTVASGGVARQDPPAGTEVARDSTVSIAVSLGPDLVAVPPLADLTVQQTEEALTAAGLVLGEVLGDPAGIAVKAEVDGTVLVANVMLPRGTAVDVTFEVPPPPSTEPPATTTTVV